MNQPIKFQAWNRKEKKMYTDVLVGNNIVIYDIDPEANEYDWDFLDCGDIDIRQYTGTEDANGLEVYRGDILQWNRWEAEGTRRPDVYVVDWLQRENRYSVNVYRGGKHLEEHDDILIIEGDFSIAGNIFQNPELVEGIKKYKEQSNEEKA